MAGGLVALLDDIAALVKLAAASLDDIGAAAGRASLKATGVVVDDTAVTPRYVEGLKPERELPIIKKIALGSIRNKLLIILPVIMLLSQFLPWLLTPILMIGGAYLAYEGAEKIWELITGHATHPDAAQDGPVDEAKVVSSAVRTDFILSAEIMVIALNEVADEPFVSRLIILIVVALLITALVYGVVGLIVKMDDLGLKMAAEKKGFGQRFGRGLVSAMPKVLSVLSTVGIAAMLWVGGHILLVGMNDLGFTPVYDFVHHLETLVHDVGGVGGILAWLVNTIASAILGLIVGMIIVGVMHLLPKKSKGSHEGAEASAH